jgi:hypothetical protein
MDTTTALASSPNSTDEIAEAVSSPDSPPTVAEISDVASGIAGGDVRIAVNENRMNLRQRSMFISGCGWLQGRHVVLDQRTPASEGALVAIV